MIICKQIVVEKIIFSRVNRMIPDFFLMKFTIYNIVQFIQNVTRK
jgi:hypothetical protein